MKLKIYLIFTAVLLISFFIQTGFCDQLDGWIKSETCWVAKSPSDNAKIIGIIKIKAAVTIEDAEGKWLKIIYAPVRDPVSGKWINCSECYIKKENFTTLLPAYW